MSESIQVVATIVAKEDSVERLVEAVTGALAPTRAEDGCLRYDFFRVRRDETTFVMLEEWASMDAVRAHGAAEHFQALSNVLAEVSAVPPKVQFLEPVGQ